MLGHAAEHALHEHDEACEVFETVQNSPALTIVLSTAVLACSSQQAPKFIEPVLLLKYTEKNTIRAPPKLF